MNENFWKWYGHWLLKVFSFKWINKYFIKGMVIGCEFICSIALIIFSIALATGDSYIDITRWWLFLTIPLLFICVGHFIYGIKKLEV